MVVDGKDILVPVPTLDISGDSEVVNPGLKTFALDGSVHLVGEKELDLYADHVSGDGPLGLLDAVGNVRLREFDTTIAARALHMDSYKRSGLIADATLYRPPYYITAKLFTIDGAVLTATNALVTTCPPGRFPLYRIVARRVIIDQMHHRVRFEGASVYAEHIKVIEVRELSRSYTTSMQGGATTDPLRQRVGYDSYDGFYLALITAVEEQGLPIQLRTVISEYGFRGSGITTHVTLLSSPARPLAVKATATSVFRTLRLIAQPDGLPVPQDDPLKFHNFVTTSPFDAIGAQPLTGPLVTASADAILDQRFTGRRVANLLVTREPELTLVGAVPLGNSRPGLPTLVDPVGLREALAHPDFVARVVNQYGFYHELPSHESASRISIFTSVESRPILIGHNTLFHPMIDATENHYGDHDYDYRYAQCDMAVEHVFSTTTALGAEYIRSYQSGTSPFVFDSLDLPDELDLTAQVGNKRYVLGGRVQYDLDHGQVYDLQVTAGPNFGSVIPTIGYDQKSSSIELGINISGLNY
jgi:hypothetical protein